MADAPLRLGPRLAVVEPPVQPPSEPPDPPDAKPEIKIRLQSKLKKHGRMVWQLKASLPHPPTPNAVYTLHEQIGEQLDKLLEQQHSPLVAAGLAHEED